MRLQAAMKELRRQYEECRDLKDPEAINEKLQYAKDIDIILRKNVVQGVQSEKRPGTYELRITEETELGYNDDIKKNSNRKTTNLANTGRNISCCGGSSNNSAQN